MLIKERTLLLVPTAPMLVPARNPKELAWRNPFLAGVIPIQVGTLEYDEREIVGVSVHSRIESRHKLGESAMRPLVGISPDSSCRSPCHPFRITDLPGTSVGHRVLSCLILLVLRACCRS